MLFLNLILSFSTFYFETIKDDGTPSQLIEKPDTIINTSCEHISEFSKWYDKLPEGKLIILQSNNYFEIDEHVNCSNSLTQFSASAPMKKVLYEGELDLGKYTRYMKIGRK